MRTEGDFAELRRILELAKESKDVSNLGWTWSGIAQDHFRNDRNLPALKAINNAIRIYRTHSAYFDYAADALMVRRIYSQV